MLLIVCVGNQSYVDSAKIQGYDSKFDEGDDKDGNPYVLIEVTSDSGAKLSKNHFVCRLVLTALVSQELVKYTFEYCLGNGETIQKDKLERIESLVNDPLKNSLTKFSAYYCAFGAGRSPKDADEFLRKHPS